jgi:hypothetical protein
VSTGRNRTSRRSPHSPNSAAQTTSTRTRRHWVAAASGKFKSPLGHNNKTVTSVFAGTRAIVPSRPPSSRSAARGCTSLAGTRTSHTHGDVRQCHAGIGPRIARSQREDRLRRRGSPAPGRGSRSRVHGSAHQNRSTHRYHEDLHTLSNVSLAALLGFVGVLANKDTTVEELAAVLLKGRRPEARSDVSGEATLVGIGGPRDTGRWFILRARSHSPRRRGGRSSDARVVRSSA